MPVSAVDREHGDRAGDRPRFIAWAESGVAIVSAASRLAWQTRTSARPREPAVESAVVPACRCPRGVSCRPRRSEQQEMQKSFHAQSPAWRWLLAVFLVFVVMAMQFESLVHPFVILLSVPLGAIGVAAALVLTATPVSVLVLIGAVMLAGIVVNNAIVLVDAVNRRRSEGQGLDEAIRGAARERLRPILMTTTTTVLALLPMTLGLGAGDELRAPLAVTVIGGLTGATLLTLVVVPCLYRTLSRPTSAPEPSLDTAEVAS